MRTTQPLGYSGSVHGSLNDRKRRIARTDDELTLIRGAGVVVAPAPKRGLKGHHTRVNSHGSRAIGLDDTRVYNASGELVRVIPRRKPRTRKPATPVEIIPTVAVRVRHKRLRGTISDYITMADAYGLDAARVAALYRDRANNGYAVTPRIAVAEASGNWATDKA